MGEMSLIGVQDEKRCDETTALGSSGYCQLGDHSGLNEVHLHEGEESMAYNSLVTNSNAVTVEYQTICYASFLCSSSEP